MFVLFVSRYKKLLLRLPFGYSFSCFRRVHNDDEVSFYKHVRWRFLIFFVFRILAALILTQTFAASICLNLKCEFGTPKCDPQFNACYYCNVKDIVVTERNLKVSSLKQASSGESVIDTQILRLENQIVIYLPSKLDKFAPKTQVLKIQSTGLKTLTHDDLKGFHHLRKLYVTGNELTTLPSNLLQIDADIVFVDFSNNKLINVGLNLFDSKAIRSASFINNLCISSSAGSYDLDGVKALEELLTNSCPPTHEMLLSQIEWLRSEKKILQEKLSICKPFGSSKTTTRRPCRKREEVDFRLQVDLSTICQDDESLPSIFN